MNGHAPAKIALISNGPSAELFDTYPREMFDTVIGVNWVVERWLCDWWAFCDYTTFLQYTPLADDQGRIPRIFAKWRSLRKIAGLAPKQQNRVAAITCLCTHESIIAPCDTSPAWNATSGTAGLGLAWNLRGVDVYAFGADMHGISDHTGRDNEASRHPVRWREELERWQEITQAIEAYGGRVHRIIE